MLVIEIDGDSHKSRREEDKIRTEHLNSLGIVVIRYTNEDVLKRLPAVKKDLIACLNSRAAETP